MENFNSMELPKALMQSLKEMKFNTPTPIQAQAIPVALEGKDILGSAQTGTGKTAAFGIPLIANLLSDNRSTALVMTPTRELASQVMNQLKIMLGKKSSINTALLIGGEHMGKQLSQLRRRPRLVVGTPGRINDHLQRKTLNLSNTNFLVLDETDRMLDMGFTIQIENVMQFMPSSRQTLLFSATLPANIVSIANKYLQDPVRIAVEKDIAPAKNIQQDMLRVSETDKYPTLTAQLSERQGSIIVFVKTKRGTEKLADQLTKEGHLARAIHGDLRQHRRDKVINAFRKKHCRILVATDVAARGLDIPHIEHVINYDLPQCPEDYIHRIGRTARAGASGYALNIIAPSDKRNWYDIERLLNPQSAKSMPRPPRNKKFGGRGKSSFKSNTKSSQSYKRGDKRTRRPKSPKAAA